MESNDTKTVSDAEDRKKIQALHQRDEVASKTGDFSTLRSIVSDDAVILNPGSAPLQGKPNIDESFKKMQASGSNMEVLSYQFNFQEVTIVGDFAFEWGFITGSYRMNGSTDIHRSKYNVMRVLRKEGKGEWKVYRSIWNEGKD